MKRALEIFKRTLAWLLPCLFMGAALSSCEDWLDDDGHDLAIGNFADGLDTPWEMVFAPDGRMFVTQRPGTISVIDKNGNETIWLQLDSVVAEVGESGLFGIELDPEFQQNHYVYFVFTCTEQSASGALSI